MKIFFQKTKTKFRRRTKRLPGFSFIEVIFSVALMAVGMMAAIQLMSGNLDQTLDSRNQVIAAELAQEGIELVRNVRDNNWTSGSAATFDHFPSSNAVNCRIDYNYSYPNNLSCDGKYGLNLSGGYYGSTSSATKFQRKVFISYSPGSSSSSATSAQVTSIVIWGSSFPVSTANCNTATKCAWAQVTLTKWGGN
jgi:Tfp pilus assembly protein PilV